MIKYMRLELYCATTDTVITTIDVPSGTPACLTGVIDLPAGHHEIYLRARTVDSGDSGSFGDTALQVIVGQTVDTPGCISGGGGCS